MDRQGYETGAGYGHNTTGNGKPMGQKIKESIPGTEEHHMQQAGMTGTGPATGYGHTGDVAYGHQNTGYGTGHTGQPMGQTIKENIPGTRQYEATHGMTGAHRMTEQAKAYIPGTEEHRISQATTPSAGMMGSTHTHDPTTGGYDRSHEHAATHTGTGGTGMGDTGVTGQQKSVGEKIKEVIPGTREHEAKKMAEGRF